MRQRPKIILAASAAVILTAASACSSSGGATAGASDTGATPIKIGAVCNCSGTATAGAANNAGEMFQAWVKYTNAKGGLNGHPIDLDFKDDANDPAKSTLAATDLIKAGVAVIVDVTSLSSVWTKQAADAGIPVVGGYNTSDQFDTDPNSYPSGGTASGLTPGLIDAAKNAGATKLGMLYCAEYPQCQEAVKPFTQAASAAGMKVVYSGSISETAPNYAAQCVAAKQAGVQALYIAASAETTLRVGPDCITQGYQGKFLAQGVGYALGYASQPAFAGRLFQPFGVAPLFDDSNPGIKTMKDAAEKYFPGMTKDPKLFAETSVEAWTGGLLIAKAIQDLAPAADATVTAKDVKGALDKIDAPDGLDGMTPPIKFSAGKPHPISCWFPGAFKGSAPTLLNSGKAKCTS